MIIALLLVAAVAGCGPQDSGVPQTADDMSCTEVAEAIDVAIQRGQRFVAAQETDVALAADLIFVLSEAEVRPECVDADVRSRAEGLRATLNGMAG